MAKITVDGPTLDVKPGERLIDAINRAKIQVPQVCYHPQLGPIQACDVSPPFHPAAELSARLQNAPAEHAEAMLALYDVVQHMHDRGVLDLVRGALGGGEKVIETLVELGDSPEAIRGLRNVLILAKAMASFDPESLQCLARALPQAVDTVRAQEAEAPGFMGLLCHFKSKDLRHGVVFVNALLETFGRNLPCDKQT
jgi:uncharacterized protein YjgD (DUF1641 family)